MTVDQRELPPIVDVVPLNEAGALDEFDSGDSDLNDFIRQSAKGYESRRLARTYVCLQDGRPVGYYSLCADAIRLSKAERLESFGKAKPHAEYPAAKIARLAVDKRKQGTGLGRRLVQHAVGQSLAVSATIGCRFVTVDAYPAATAFYAKLGFQLNQNEPAKPQNASLRLDIERFQEGSSAVKTP